MFQLPTCDDDAQEVQSIIGRSVASNLRLPERHKPFMISRKHATITCLRANGRNVYTIVDNESTNGTFVEDVNIPSVGGRVLAGDEIVSFGGPRTCIDRDGLKFDNPYQFRFIISRGLAQVGSTSDAPVNCASTRCIDEILQCSVCHDAVVDAHVLPCSHNFCGECILKWHDTLKNKNQGTTCPNCRAPYAAEPTPNPSLDKLYELTVQPRMPLRERRSRDDRVAKSVRARNARDKKKMCKRLLRSALMSPDIVNLLVGRQAPA
ncbi:hypothetical protein CYMTET_40918 [Cymbomonas tetramitiformis]|uniref:E3 ubiquitin-protein ligase CHFR n=1 Tax=Cymbomonas tetramitiformis TaxID=36881 RepID=A0AAE0F2R0_9CHLO|nr:hypothetical protein CYMTET_40918 [Cymbomonas tetramitiformis]